MEKMGSNINHIYDNYDDENIEDVLAIIEQERTSCSGNSVFTMKTKNSPCAVTITEKSRAICADILTEI